MKRDTMPVAELPMGMVIKTKAFGDDAMTVTKVTHHKAHGTVRVEGIDTKTGQPVQLRFLDGIEFCI
jgi:hypothetical protein